VAFYDNPSMVSSRLRDCTQIPAKVIERCGAIDIRLDLHQALGVSSAVTSWSQNKDSSDLTYNIAALSSVS
jgi:hypothetical protein